MDATPQTVEIPDTVYRVGRGRSPLYFGEIDALDAEIDDVGNRFDVVGAGVMYAATRRKAACKETLRQFRPSASGASLEPLRDECWAIFDGVVIGSQSSGPILPSDEDFEAVAKEFGITIH